MRECEKVLSVFVLKESKCTLCVFVWIWIWVCNFPNISYFSTTVPNPPGPLNITERTTSSLCVQWKTPGLMTGAPDISYNISYLSTGTGASSQSTSSLRHNLLSLSSGTFYTITVITVGPQNLGSAPVNTSGYTCTYTCEFFLILCTVDAWSCMDQLVEHGACTTRVVGSIPGATDT